jgi:hypothetical protein
MRGERPTLQLSSKGIQSYQSAHPDIPLGLPNVSRVSGSKA